MCKFDTHYIYHLICITHYINYCRNGRTQKIIVTHFRDSRGDSDRINPFSDYVNHVLTQKWNKNCNMQPQNTNRQQSGK